MGDASIGRGAHVGRDGVGVKLEWIETGGIAAHGLDAGLR